MIGRAGLVVTVALVAAAGAGASVLVSGVGASTRERLAAGCSTDTTATPRVTVTCTGLGGEVTLPGGREVTVDVAGGSGGSAGGRPGGHGALVHATWTPDQDTVVWTALGLQGVDGLAGLGALGGTPSIVLPAPDRDKLGTPGPWWLFVAGGGGGRGRDATLGTAGDGGVDPVTGAGGNGGGGATGGTLDAPGQGSALGGDALGPLGGLGVLGGGSGGSGFNGGGGGGLDGGGGGAGASSATAGTASFATAAEPGAGWARFSWTVATAPQITSAASVAFVAGRPGSFTVSAVGNPTPQLSVDGLPEGLTFTDDGDGTGVISGQPPAGYGGDVTITVRASNGTGTDAVQQLQMHIALPAPAGGDPTAPTFTSGLPPLAPIIRAESQKDPEPVPVAAKTVVLTPVSGTIMITLPDGTTSELEAGEEIPVGSIVDATAGVVRLTAARDATGVLQTAVFWHAVFRVTQQADPSAGGRASAAAASSKQLLTALTLKQQPTGCDGKARSAGARKGTGGLWGDGHGRFSVRGNSSSATVRGTKWYVENRCDGTYTRVVRGIVAVRDFVTKRTIVLRAGGTYTAKKRHRR